MSEEKQGVTVTERSENGASSAEEKSNSDEKSEENATIDKESALESSQRALSVEAFDENSEQVLAEEARLEALDATPQTRKRSAIILTTMAILAVILVVVVVIMPPLSWKPPKKDVSKYHSVLNVTTTAVEPGDIRLSYASIESSRSYRYRLTLEQASQFSDERRTRTQLESDIVFTRPERSYADGEISFQLQEVSAQVFDGDREVTLASPGDLLAGISLFSKLESQTGLGSVVPDANMNPQVKRVLFTVADALRFAWSPLPEVSLGLGSRWSISSNASESPYIRKGETTLSEGDEGYKLTTRYTFESSGQVVGNGEVTTILREGRVMSSEGKFSRDTLISGSAMQRQEMVFTLKFQSDREK